jgi:hypothetical protein
LEEVLARVFPNQQEAGTLPCAATADTMERLPGTVSRLCVPKVWHRPMGTFWPGARAGLMDTRKS